MMTATILEPEVIPTPPINGDVLYEVINGQYVELPPMSTKAVRVATVLVSEVEVFAKGRELGRAASEMLFGLGVELKLQRRPDAAFVSYERWPKDRELPDTDPWPVVPNLAAEVVSKNELAEDLLTKVQEYFQAGVQLVWVVYPRLRLVHVYESFTQIRVLTHTEELDGGGVLPGFRLPLATLFPEPTS
jgi:Uma2 family endonuclease